MICYIYRSTVKTEMYLYTTTKDNFDEVPEQLLKAFGKPDFSMVINLDKRTALARVNISAVKEQLAEVGYYLQMPPTISQDKNLLTPDES